MAQYRLTILFTITALMVGAIATFAVNHIIGNLTEDTLVAIGEGNTGRDALHAVSMLRVGDSMAAMHSLGATGRGQEMGDMRHEFGLMFEIEVV